MEYGAAYPKWAPFAKEDPEPAGKLPNYGTAVEIGSLNKVTDSPVFNEAKGYGDNHLVVYLNKFKEAAIGVEVTEIPRKVLSSVSGAERTVTGRPLTATPSPAGISTLGSILADTRTWLMTEPPRWEAP